MPLPQIERPRACRTWAAPTISAPNSTATTYRLKFMQDGRVIWVDVDAATGRIVRRSGD